MNKPVAPSPAIRGEEHWTQKGDVRLFLFEKYAPDPSGPAGTILFVHGSSMASQPTFDLHVPGHPDSSVMDWFAARGFDCWCVDMEGYGRSTKDRDNNAPIAQGADDCFAAASYRARRSGAPMHLRVTVGLRGGESQADTGAKREPSGRNGRRLGRCFRRCLDPGRRGLPQMCRRGHARLQRRQDRGKDLQ